MNVDQIILGLRENCYIPDENTARVLNYSLLLNKPLLIEGPAGAGKTELAKAFSQLLGRELIRLQCYEGIDESQALYEWNYQKQLLYIQGKSFSEKDGIGDGVDVYTRDFLLHRPLLKAIENPTPSILLIDEIDKSDEEFESFLLEILSDWQITIPEIGTIPAITIPFVILTSNSTRNLSQALRRRCLYLYLDYPTEERELAILKIHFPMMKDTLGKQVISFIRKTRLERLKKHPSISEVIDWVDILEKSNIENLVPQVALNTLNILFKYREDVLHMEEKISQEDWYNGILHT